MGKTYLMFSAVNIVMEGHKIALGLILLLISSGCAEMTGEASDSPSFDELALDVDSVERVTGEEYSSTEEGNFSDSFVNVSSVVNSVESYFTREGNLSEAPDSIQSMVVALNSSSNDSFDKMDEEEIVDVEGYEARKLNSTNRTMLYSENDNISFAVQTEGGEGFYSSARELYSEIAERVEAFENRSS